MYLARLALKNALRKPGRSLITASSVVVGVAMLIFAWGFLVALDRAVVHGQIHSDTGHLRILAQGYAEVEEEGELDLLIDEAAAVERLVLEAEPDALPLPRLAFAAELSDGRDGLRARGIGIEPERTFAAMALPLESKLEGPLPAGLEPMWLGAELARAFGVQPGATLTVLTRTRPGSYTAQEFAVAGLVRSQNPAIDNQVFFVPLGTVRALLECPQAATDLVVLLEDRDAAGALAARLAPALAGRGLVVQTWLERAEPLLRINRLRRRIFGLFVGILLLIAATGIANTVVMSCFERVREIGTLRALGFQTEGVVLLLLAESLVIGLAGSAAGAGLGAWVVYALEGGLDFSRFTAQGQYSVSLASVLYFTLDWQPIAVAFTVGLVVTMLAAIAPAVKFSRLGPAEAMRR